MSDDGETSSGNVHIPGDLTQTDAGCVGSFNLHPNLVRDLSLHTSQVRVGMYVPSVGTAMLVARDLLRTSRVIKNCTAFRN
jgi:hypothetical protein